MTRKFLPLILTLCVILFVGTLCASAAEVASGTCGTGVTWVLDDEGTLTISGIGNMKYWGHQAHVEWYSYRDLVKNVVVETGVTGISDYAFYDCSNLIDVSIGSSVKSIGQYAFYSCNSLVTMIIPDNVESVGKYCFDYCINLTDVFLGKGLKAVSERMFGFCDNLVNITISNGLEKIEKSAFANCINLKNINIPDSVTRIESDTFWRCISLESITLPNSISSIAEYTFYNCSSLKSVVMPKSIKSIQQRAFSECNRALTVYYLGSITDWNDITINSYNALNNVITDNRYIISYNANGGVNSPESHFATRGELAVLTEVTTTRGGYEFAGWSTTQNGKAEYAPGAEYIGDKNTTFYAVWVPNSSGNCGFNLKWKMYGTKLTITGTGSMTNWSESANVPWNAHKSKIETVVISDGATSIGSYAFSDCENLKTVTFTESVTKINSHAFDNASSIETVNFTGKLEDLENIEINNYNDSFMNASFNCNHVIIYTISYNTLGGMSDIQEQSKKHGEPITLSTEVPKKIGHAFKGWSIEQGGDVIYNAGDEYTENADIVLYAVWEEVMGDASGDGEITNEDITIVADAMFGKTLTEEEFKYANVYDEDNEINVKDLIKLAQMMTQNK